jgi:general secretion pathway protein H
MKLAFNQLITQCKHDFMRVAYEFFACIGDCMFHSGSEPKCADRRDKPQLAKRESGFSLIEILIALVVGALIISLATLSFGDKRKEELEQQSLRLYALLKQAQDETVLRGIDIGLRIEDNKYWFYTYDIENDKWLPITDDAFFTEKTIPDSLEIKVVVDGSTLFAEGEDDIDIFERDVEIFEEEQQPIDPPQIYILSSGEMNEFKVAIGWTDEEPRYYLIAGTMLGDITMEGPLSGNLRHEVTDESVLNL